MLPQFNPGSFIKAFGPTAVFDKRASLEERGMHPAIFYTFHNVPALVVGTNNALDEDHIFILHEGRLGWTWGRFFEEM